MTSGVVPRRRLLILVLAGAAWLAALPFAAWAVGSVTRRGMSQPATPEEWVAWGTFELAWMTLGLALSTLWLGYETREVSRRTAELAAETDRELTMLKAQIELQERALAVGQQQTNTAVAALEENRRLRFASAIPVLSLEPTAMGVGGNGMPFMRFMLRNEGEQPAVHVRLRAFSQGPDMQVSTIEAAHSHRIAVVGRDYRGETDITSMDLANIADARGGRPSPDFRYASERYRIVLEYKGLLGGRFEQRYDWYTRVNAQVWNLSEFELRPDPENKDWLDVVTPDLR